MSYETTMPTYFHGWRRKIGILTLMMGCVFAAAWVRSRSITDTIWVEGYGYIPFMVSSPDGFSLGITETFLVGFASIVGNQKLGPVTWYAVREPLMYFKFTSFPYWSIVIPLTLLSAYLLISKTRSAKLAAPNPESLS